MTDLDRARQRVSDYLRSVLDGEQGSCTPEYDDGYIDGLEYALKLLERVRE